MLPKRSGTSLALVLVCCFQACWCKEAPSDLSARTLFYSEQPDTDKAALTEALNAAQSKQVPRNGRKGNTNAAAQNRAASAKAFGREATEINGVNSNGVQPAQSGFVLPVQHLGLRYNVVLVDKQSGKISAPLDPKRDFGLGECVALQVEANRSGYLYVLEQASSGRWIPLFPSPKLPNASNIVPSRGSLIVPEGGCFRIKPPNGEEKVFVVLSRRPEDIYDLLASFQPDNSDARDSLLAQAVKRLEPLKGRDLEVETVAQPQNKDEAPNSVYVVNAANFPSQQVVTEILIKHN